MFKLIEMAFRNVFRNFSRSILTIFITAVSVTTLIFGSSFLDGAITTFLNENIKMTGHVRITAPNYEIYEKMLSLDHNVTTYQQIKDSIKKQPDINQKVKVITGIVKFGGVVYNGDPNQESSGFGIEPSYFDVLGLKKAIYQGRVLSSKVTNEILIGRRMAENLKIKINSDVTIVGRTIYNSVSLANFKVVGLFDLQNSKLNKSFYLTLPAAQQLLDMGGMVTEILVFGKTRSDTGFLVSRIKKLSGAKTLELKTWDSIGEAPSFLGLINVIAKTILTIIIILAGLGITNTMLMAIMERRREIGLLKSLGMREGEIVTLFTIEGLILGLTGLVAGLLMGGSLSYYTAVHGVHFGSALQGVPFATSETVYGNFSNAIFIRAVVLTVAAGLLASLLPSSQGVKVGPADALRQ